jgi:hypothetical protein
MQPAASVAAIAGHLYHRQPGRDQTQEDHTWSGCRGGRTHSVHSVPVARPRENGAGPGRYPDQRLTKSRASRANALTNFPSDTASVWATSAAVGRAQSISIGIAPSMGPQPRLLMWGTHDPAVPSARPARAAGFCLKVLGRHGLVTFGASPPGRLPKGSDSRSLRS